MFGSTILELAISLVFVYLVFSLVCSGIKEWLHYLLSIRSKTLEEAISKMLKSQALVKELYSHHLVQEAAQSGVFKKAWTSHDKTANQSIDSNNEEDERVEKPVNIPAQSFAKALIDSVIRLAQQKDTSEEAKKAFDDVKAGIARIANSEARKLLTELLDKAQTKAVELKDDIDKTSKVVFQWFDIRMAKLSDWYRRKTRKLIFFFAIVLVVLFNVDSIMLIKTLSQNPQLRAAIISQAENLSNQSSVYLGRRNTTPPNPPGNGEPAQDNTSGNNTQGMDTETFFQELEALKAQVRSTGLPLGWSKASENKTFQNPRALPHSLMGWIYKIIGLIISLMAIGMGAPFWFDVLKWLIGLRKKTTASTAADSAKSPAN